jgi:hypothetical protein
MVRKKMLIWFLFFLYNDILNTYHYIENYVYYLNS